MITLNQKIFRVISALLILSTLIPLLFWNDLEGVQIPRHYNSDTGEVDGWGGMWVFFAFTGVSAFIYWFISLIIRYSEKYPDKISCPVKITDNNRASVLALNIRLMESIRMITLAIFSYASISTLLVALGHIDRISEWGIELIIAILFADIIYFFIRCMALKD